MSTIQAGIAARVPAHGRYLSLALRPDADAAVRTTLQALAAEVDGLHTVVGLGATLVARLDAAVPGLRSFSAPPASRVDLPATPAELWLWLRSEDDPGALLQRGRALARLLAPAFDVTHELAAFRHQDGRDLTGYEDGTENPTGRDMVDTIGVQGQGPGLDGGSFVAVQQWEHALERFDRFDRPTQDRMIGRRRDDNVELDDAPPAPTCSAPRRRASPRKPLSCGARCRGSRARAAACTSRPSPPASTPSRPSSPAWQGSRTA